MHPYEIGDFRSLMAVLVKSSLLSPPGESRSSGFLPRVGIPESISNHYGELCITLVAIVFDLMVEASPRFKGTPVQLRHGNNPRSIYKASIGKVRKTYAGAV